MRLSFPKGEHQDVIVQPGEITIGSAPDNQVVLARDGIRAHHASIMVDPRGYTLFVRERDARSHVNARPVRELALLRLGDVISLNDTNLVLKPDHDESVSGLVPPPAGEQPMSAQDESGNETRYRQVPPKAVLRGVSGPFFGKVVPVNGRLVIGRGEDCDLVLDEPEMSRAHASIEVTEGEIYLRDLGSTNGTFVNGVQVRDATLFSGDQIAFDRNRFLIEAPGMPVRRADARPASEPRPQQPQVTQTMRAIRADTPAPPAIESKPAPSSQGVWWLLGAAVLIALGLALLFLGFR